MCGSNNSSLFWTCWFSIVLKYWQASWFSIISTIHLPAESKLVENTVADFIFWHGFLFSCFVSWSKKILKTMSLHCYKIRVSWPRGLLWTSLCVFVNQLVKQQLKRNRGRKYKINYKYCQICFEFSYRAIMFWT